MIDLQRNLATIIPSSSVPLDITRVPEAIRGAGFRPGAMSIRATGVLSSRHGRVYLTIDGQPSSYPWKGGETDVTAGVAFEADVDYAEAPPAFSPHR